MPDSAGEEKGAERFAPSPYQQATESIRAAARWLMTAFAAVGGVLVAGVPLSDLGRLEVRSARFVLAVSAVAVALVAIGYMIRTVARVFTARYVSFGELAAADFPEKAGRQRRVFGLQQLIDASREELYGAEAKTLAELATRLREVNELVRKEAVRDEETRDQAAREDALRAGRDNYRRQARLEHATARVLDFANYEFTRRTFQRMFRRLVVAGTVVALAVAAYAVLIRQAPTESPSLDGPVPMVLTLNPNARAWEDILGPGCELSSVEAVAVAGTLDDPEVVTAETDRCSAVRLELSENDGVAVPVVREDGGN